MNKKFMSFVLAMVLSVGLGVSAFSSTNESFSSGGTNSGVARQAGQSLTSADALVDRISNVWHYEHGILTHTTGADGSITLLDRGQVRMSLTLGLNGEYSVSSVMAYDTDLDEIEAAGGLENWLKKWGVTEEQLQGGGSPAQWVEITSAEYEEHEGETDDDGNPLYKKEEQKDENGNVKKDENGNIMYTYKKYDPGKDAEKVHWLDSAMNHLSGGINRSISINFNATDGASVTFNTNGKAYDTYAWDGELIASNKYIVIGTENGVITRQAEMDLVQKDGQAVSTEDIEDYATNKDNYKKAWSITRTVGGRVISCVNDANPDQELRRYDYNDAGQLTRVLDFVNGTITINNPNGSTTLSALSKDMNLSKMTNAEIDALISDATIAAGRNANVDRSTGFYISQSVVNNINGTTNYSINRDDSGKTTTVAYIGNKQVSSCDGVKSADYLRAQATAQYNYVLNGGKAPAIGSDVVTVYWYADQLKEVSNDSAMLDRFITSMGWDVNDKNREDALKMINDSLNFSSGNGSPALSLSYTDTTYTQSAIDQLEEENGVTVSNIPSKRFVNSVTVYHHNAQSYTLNFGDKDPSLARVSYITLTSLFNDSILDSVCEELGITLTETTSISEYQDIIDKIISKLTAEFSNIKADRNADDAVAALSKKYFKDPKKMKLVIKEEDRETGEEHDDSSSTAVRGGNFDAYEERTGGRRYTGWNTDDVQGALDSLLGKVKTYLQKFVSTIQSGSAVSVQEYININGDTEDSEELRAECTVYHDYVALTRTVVDPVVVGKPVVTDDGKLKYGAGSTVYLEDGTSYVLQEGEEIIVDISDLDSDVKEKLLASADGKTDIMTMGNVKVDAEKGTFEMSADSNYTTDPNNPSSGGYAMGDDIAKIEAELAKGEDSAISWISENTKLNSSILKDGYEDWKAGWQKLVEYAAALF